MKVNLNLTDLEASTGGLADLVPAGVYAVSIAGVSFKENKTKTGGYMEIVLKIVRGEHTGKTIVERLNVSHPKEDVVKIGLSKLKGILTVAKHQNPNMLVDTDEMLKLSTFMIVVDIEKSVDGDKEYTNNTIKKYKVDDGSTPEVAQQTTATAATVAAPNTAAAPPFAQPVTAPSVAQTEAKAAAPTATTFPWGQPK